MKLKLTESQIERLMNEQLTQPKDQTDFSNYIKQFDTIKINNNSFTPDDFLKKLNNLYQYHLFLQGTIELHYLPLGYIDSMYLVQL